jgi:transposase-like protein
LSFGNLAKYRNLDENICRAWWFQLLHPDGPRCPRCKSAVVDGRVETFRDGGRVKCHSCDRWFTLRTGTPVQGMTADWRQLTTLTWLSFQGHSLADIARACRISDDTARRYLKRLRA